MTERPGALRDPRRATPDAARTARPRDRPGHRRDVQGLRALAVLGVIAEHVTGRPAGGFVGVDVFFVISGFLITGNLLARLRSGAALPARSALPHYLGDFYRRRVRRLLPAALVTVALTVAASWVLLPASRAHDVARDGVASVAFWANWHFAALGTDYFTADRPVSPLQHFWSLAVEEQFYVVWPVVMFALVAVVARLLPGRDRRRVPVRGVVALAAVVVVAASLWVAVEQSRSDPAAAYFSTVVRGWELGLGALLAAVAPRVRPGRWTATALSLLGTAAVLVSFVVVRGGDGFPVPGALLPCVGSVLVLAAGCGAHEVRNPVLTSRPAVWVGDLSYSLYLVHFPVLVLVTARAVSGGAAVTATVLLLTLGAAIWLRALVERPVLQSRWLLPRSQERPAPSGHRRGRSVVRLTAAGAALCLAALAAYTQAPSVGERDAARYDRIRAALARSGTGTQTEQAVAAPSTVPQLRRELDRALAATRYPDDLTPSMDAVVAGPQARAAFVRCAQASRGTQPGCSWGDPDAEHVVYLAGDSTAMVWAQALARVVEQLPGWRLRFAAMAGCHLASVVYETPNPVVADTCGPHVRAVSAEVERLRPDLLVVGGAYAPYPQPDGGGPVTATQYAAQQLDALAPLRRYAGRVAMIEPPPGGRSPAQCYRRGSSPAACAYRPPAFWRRTARAVRTAAAREDVDYLGVKQYFCGAGDFCPPFAAGTPTMHDVTHAAPDYVDRVAPLLGSAMRRAGLLPAASRAGVSGR